VTLDPDPRWQQPSVGLIDFEDKQGACGNGTEPTNLRLVGSVPVGQYKGLRFAIGVPSELNHRQLTDSRPPLDLTALFWSWNSGHLFMKVEASAAVAGAGDAGASSDAADGGTVASAGTAGNVFALHLGSVLCEGKPAEGGPVVCQRPNRGAIDLPAFVPGASKVVVDFAEIFAESQLQTLPGCHSFAGGDACTAPLSRLGIDPVSGQGAPTQKVFRVE
jgi:uncharacterized repeat protein (TIGR04052 family)